MPLTGASSLALVAEKQNAHSLGVTSVAFSPDGKTIVSGSYDNTLKVWGVRPFLDSEWEEVDISAMPKDGDGDVKIEGLGYIKKNYWKNTITGDFEQQKPHGCEGLPLEPAPAKSGVRLPSQPVHIQQSAHALLSSCRCIFPDFGCREAERPHQRPVWRINQGCAILSRRQDHCLLRG